MSASARGRRRTVTEDRAAKRPRRREADSPEWDDLEVEDLSGKVQNKTRSSRTNTNTPSVVDFSMLLREAGFLDVVSNEPGVGVDVQRGTDVNTPNSSLPRDQHLQPVTMTTGEVSQGSPAILPGSMQTIVSNPSAAIQPMRCANDDLYVHVPGSLRQAICRGEYVNLALLLKGGLELQDLCSSGTLRLTSDGSIEARPKEFKEKITDIETWTNAFIVFTSIYITAHPDKAGELLQYLFNIRDCAARQGGSAWRTYDEQFRIRQAANPISWATIHNELWWRCIQVRSVPQQTAAVFGVRTQYSCDAFNNGFCQWPSCKYPHVCSGCGLGHRVTECPGKGLGASRAQPATMSAAVGNTQRGFMGGLFRGQQRGAFQSGRWQGRGRRGWNRGVSRYPTH